MQINNSTLAALYKGYRVIFMAALQGASPMWPKFAMKTTSSNAEELYHWLGAVPGMRKLIGEIVIRNLSANRYSISNDEFESTVAVKQADIERDNYGIYNPLMQAMGVAAAQHPDELVANLLINGFNSRCYTGKNFFDTNHDPSLGAIKGATKFTNIGTKKLSADNFRDARTNIKSRLNAEGRPMNLGLDLVLAIAPQNETLGKQILQSDFIQQTAKQGANVVAAAAVSNVDKGSARLEVWPQLAAEPDMWFVFDAGQPIKPFIFQEEKAVSFTSLNTPDSDHVFKKKEFLYQAYGRYNAGYGLPELAWGSTGEDDA